MIPPRDWPHSDASLIVESPPHRWHVQRMGEGPEALLLHGAGASTHSFAELMPSLSERFRVTAIDLPGQGFTRMGTRQRSGLAAMSADIAALCRTLDLRPALIVGHSAGAAIAVRLATELPDPPRRLVALNGAFAEFDGVAGLIFPMMAKALTFNPFVAGTFARLAGSRRQVERLIAGTGSEVPNEMLECYRRLVSSPSHVEATLAMMAQWDLRELRERAPALACPALLLTGGRDRAVPSRISADFVQRLPMARHVVLPEYGHLMHEEAPEQLAEMIVAEWGPQQNPRYGSVSDHTHRSAQD